MAKVEMAEKLGNKKASGETSPPPSLPESTPSEYTGVTVSTVIEIYRTLGKVERAVEELSKQSAVQQTKLDGIGNTVHTGRGILIAVSAILTILGGTIVFFLSKIWDALVPVIQAKPHP